MQRQSPGKTKNSDCTLPSTGPSGWLQGSNATWMVEGSHTESAHALGPGCFMLSHPPRTRTKHSIHVLLCPHSFLR